MTQLPDRGIGYGLLRYLRSDGDQLATNSQIAFNYLGRFERSTDSEHPFTPAPERAGWNQNPAHQRAYVLEIVAVISASQLHLTWTYNRNLHHYRTIDRLAKTALDTLHSIIADAPPPDAKVLRAYSFRPGPTPATIHNVSA
jgi:non-ribosomal peptide synthase protein (TIGR01720 family)